MKDLLIKAAIMVPLFYVPVRFGYISQYEGVQYLILAEVFNISFLLGQLIKEMKK